MNKSVISQLVTAIKISLGSSRLMIVIPIYVMIAAVSLIPIGCAIFLASPFNPSGGSVFNSFIGDFISSPQGVLQSVTSVFYFYLFLISYLSISSIMGYEERRDRSIMFWKSLPIADHIWVMGQISSLFVAFFIGFISLFVINIVITIWETFFFTGLNYSFAIFVENLTRMLENLLRFGINTIIIIILSLPIGTSMLWFATFTKRQPGTVWLGVFVSIYVVAYLLRYIDIDEVWFILWYPEKFGKAVVSLLSTGQFPIYETSLANLMLVAIIGTIIFATCTWAARRRAMPV